MRGQFLSPLPSSFQLMLQTGLRVGEVAQLAISDCQINDRSGFVRVRAGKRGKEREVPLNASARRALAAYLKTREDCRETDPLFLSERGGESISLRTVQATIQQLARRAKVTRIPVSAHTFRHGFALGFLRRNPGKLIELATLLGHDSLDTTATLRFRKLRAGEAEECWQLMPHAPIAKRSAIHK